MEKMGADVTLKIYKGMGHIINEDEIAWVKTFIMNI
jgi:phospholipase/carboxylesterase